MRSSTRMKATNQGKKDALAELTAARSAKERRAKDSRRCVPPLPACSCLLWLSCMLLEHDNHKVCQTLIESLWSPNQQAISMCFALRLELSSSRSTYLPAAALAIALLACHPTAKSQPIPNTLPKPTHGIRGTHRIACQHGAAVQGQAA